MGRGVQFDLVNNAQLLNQTRAFNSLVDHVDTSSVLSGGLGITPTWTVGGVNGSVTAKYALMSTGGGGVVGSGSFGTTVLPNAVPNGSDGYTLLYLPINGSYPSGNISFSLVFTGATANVSSSGNPVVDLYISPRAGGELDNSTTAWTEVLGGIKNLTGWSSLNNGSTVTCTGTVAVSAIPAGKWHFVLQVAVKVTGSNSGSTAQVQLTSGTITLPTPTLFDIWEVQNICSASGFPSGGPYALTLDFPYAIGDMWVVHLRRVQTTDLNDITGKSEASTTTIVENIHSALNDSNGNIESVFTGIVTSTASSGLTPTFTANSADVGVIVEMHVRAFRNMTGAGTLTVDAASALGNGVGSPSTTGSLTFTLNHPNEMVVVEATGQSGNWRASGTPFLVDLVAANNSIWDDFVTSSGSYTLNFSQSPSNGWGINAISIFVQPSTPTIAPSSFPDRVLSNRIHASQMLSAFRAPIDRPIGISAALFQDTIDRRAMLSATQLVVTSEPPRPEQTSDVAPGIYPGAIDRLRFPAANQHVSFTSEPPFTDRTQVVAAGVYQDTIDRQRYPAANQHTQATTEPPFTDRTSPLDTGIYQAWIARAALPNSVPLYVTAEPPFPERTAPIAASAYPDWIARLSFDAARQLADTSEPPAIDRATPPAVGLFPDWIARLTFAASEQFAAPAIGPAPERSAPIAWSAFPDWIARTAFATGTHAGGVSSASFVADRPSPVCDVLAQAWIPRALTPVTLHLPVTSEPPRPERTAVETAGVYPDWIASSRMLAAEQQVATNQPPVLIANPVPTQAPWSYPDRIPPLAGLHASLQMAATSEPPLITLNPILTFYGAAYPDWIARLAFSTADQRVASTDGPAFDRGNPFGSSFQDWIARATLSNAEQQPFTDQPPIIAGAGTVPTVAYQDWIPRVVFAASEQQPFASVTEPERSSPPIAWGAFPEWIARATFGVFEQQFASSEPPLIERNSLPAPADYPAWIARLTMPASQQLSASLEPPLPQANPVPLPIGGFPAAIARLVFLTADQQTAITPPAPERTSLEAGTVYPDRIDRVLMASAEQLASSAQPPVVPASGASSIYPDRVDRVLFGAHEQLASTAEPARIERTLSIATALFPDRIDARWLTVACQMAATSEPPLPQPNVVPTISISSFQDWIARRTPPTLSFVGSPVIWFASPPKRSPRVSSVVIAVGTSRRHITIIPQD